METALINKLQKFLLELGKGYLFETRQKRFTYDEDNFYVDLVFYNRLLRCYVLIDLKVDKLTHQDIGQIKEAYSARELERQINSGYYERYMLSKERLLPEPIRELKENPFLDSYVIEFLDLPLIEE